MHHAATHEITRVTVWPSPQEYNEAVQNLFTCFSDLDLKHGEPELSPMGLPKPISGAFASVYRIRTANGDWALRCFLRNMPEQQERYERIGQHLEGIHQPHMLEFDYQPEGLLFHGRMFPILKLKWTEGVHLDQYVESSLNNPDRLDKLCLDWKAMLRWLQENGIAHGDLQHGNVLVDRGHLTLVDYDGMYVPSLAGLLSNELGHRNYQHPARSGVHFGPWLDNFAAWSIFTSLRCLQSDPDLWRKLQGGDECLLFRREDFLDPINSRAFYLLEQHPSESVRDCARLLRSFLALPIEKVPSLDDAASPPLQLAAVRGPAPTASVQGVHDSTEQTHVVPSYRHNSAQAHATAGLPPIHPAFQSIKKPKAGPPTIFLGALTFLFMVFAYCYFSPSIEPWLEEREMKESLSASPLSNSYYRKDGTTQLQPFSRVIVAGPGKFQIEVRAKTKPQYGGDAVIEQNKEWLKVSSANGRPVKLVTSSLDAVYASNARVTVKGLSSPLMRICLVGKAVFKADGLVQEAHIDVTDSGQALLNGLEIHRRADVVIRKNGWVKINVPGDLHCMVAQDGCLLYKTQPASIVRETMVGCWNFFSKQI